MIDFNSVVSSWFFLSFVALIILTYEDFNNKRRLGLNSWSVDDRKNWYMMGVTTFIVLLSPLNVWLKLFTLLIVGFLIGFVNKKGYFGTADIRSFLWLINGWFFVSWWFGIIFLVVLGLVTVFYHFMKLRAGFSSNDPFFIFIFLMHFFTFLLWFVVV